MKARKLFITTLFLVVFTFAACVKDKLNTCQDDVRIRFEYTLNAENEDLFENKINTIDLLVYNAKHQLVTICRELQANLESGNTLFIPGLKNNFSYTFVAWANTTKDSFIKDYAPVLEDLRVTYKSLLEQNYNADPTIDSFFHGSAIMSIDDLKRGKPLLLSLTNNTHKVHVSIIETQTSRPINLAEYQVELCGSNGIYNFENNTVGSDLLHYKPTYNYPLKHEVGVDFTCLRVLEDGDVNVKIYGHNSKLLYDEPLVDILRRSDRFKTQEDLDRAQEFNLKFKVKRDDSNIDIDLISINDWDSIDQNGNL